MSKRPYPTYICFDCGRKYGRRSPGICTVHTGRCDICGKIAGVTEPRDFGHLVPGWEAATKGSRE